MQGARARLRDALLLAELDHLRRRAAQGLPFDPVLYAYFSDAPSELVHVQSAAEATRHMEQLFTHSPAEGQTDITRALVSAFESLREAQRRDPRLAHATLVLVTDGEDRVDLELLRRVRAPMGRIDIALSFISLGHENVDLRALVLEQQEAGARAFYHALSDEDLAWGEQAFTAPWRTLLPLEVEVTPDSLAQLGPHLEALERLAEEGTRAPAPVATEDSFDALFPRTPPATQAPPPPERTARVADLLWAVADVAALTPAPARARESVVLLRHLLGVYGLSAPDYLQTLAAGADSP